MTELKARDNLQGQLVRAHMMSLEPISFLSSPVLLWLPSAVLHLWLCMMALSSYKNLSTEYQI